MCLQETRQPGSLYILATSNVLNSKRVCYVLPLINKNILAEYSA